MSKFDAVFNKDGKSLAEVCDDMQGEIDALGEKVDGIPGSVDAYTKAETNELLKRKQDVIDDLESIREGAERGKTALQEHQDISGKVDKEDGKGLSSNDYTDDDRKKVANALTEHQSLEGYARTTDIPTSLPASDVPDWAKQDSKPVYTASEINDGDENVSEKLSELEKLNGQYEDKDADFSIADESNNVIAEFAEGHVRTKNFDSRDVKKIRVEGTKLIIS